MKLLKTLLVLLVAAVIGVGAFIWLGVYNVAADDPHWNATYRLMQTVRDRSISTRAAAIEVPPLDDEALILSGAGNYSSMCVGCHLSPGSSDTELSLGLYPAPPTWSELGAVEPQQAFWVIKHGIKMSGMPAWGKSMEDKYIWGMVALLRQFPRMTAAQYEVLVKSSSGHAHGGGETEVIGGEVREDGDSMSGDHGDMPKEDLPIDESKPHDHPPGTPAHQDKAPEPNGGKGMKPKEEAADDHGSHDHGAEAVKPGDSMPGMNVKTESPPAAPVGPAAAVQAFQKALSSGDTQAAARYLDPAVQIFESGGIERSRDEYAAHHLISDAAFLKSAKIELLSRTGAALGNLAWVGSASRIAGAPGGKPVDITSTETMVLKQSAEGWRIVHIHWSSRPNK